MLPSSSPAPIPSVSAMPRSCAGGPARQPTRHGSLRWLWKTLHRNRHTSSRLPTSFRKCATSSPSPHPKNRCHSDAYGLHEGHRALIPGLTFPHVSTSRDEAILQHAHTRASFSQDREGRHLPPPQNILFFIRISPITTPKGRMDNNHQDALSGMAVNPDRTTAVVSSVAVLMWL